MRSEILVTGVYRQKFASGDKVTSFGKEYLCNSCLSREPTPVTELHMLSSASDADDDTGKMYKTDYNSVSAPATPARKDVSATARTAMMTDADSSLEMSTRSLLDVQNIDGMSTSPLPVSVSPPVLFCIHVLVSYSVVIDVQSHEVCKPHSQRVHLNTMQRSWT